MSADAGPFHAFCLDEMNDHLMSNKPLVANLSKVMPLFGLELTKSLTHC
jgi:hypothetical protein